LGAPQATDEQMGVDLPAALHGASVVLQVRRQIPQPQRPFLVQPCYTCGTPFQGCLMSHPIAVLLVVVGLLLPAAPAAAVYEGPRRPQLVSPSDGEVVPQNAIFVLVVDGGFDDAGSIVAVVNDGSPTDVTLDRDACENRPMCSGVVGPFALQEGDVLTLQANDPNAGEEVRWSFTASDAVDDAAPVVGPVVLLERSLGTDSGSCLAYRTAMFAPPEVDDDHPVAPGVLMHVDDERERPTEGSEELPLHSLDDERCYRMVAWDVAGHRGTSDVACFDLSLADADEEDEAARLERQCLQQEGRLACTAAKVRSTTAPGALALLWLLLVGVRHPHRPRPNGQLLPHIGGQHA